MSNKVFIAGFNTQEQYGIGGSTWKMFDSRGWKSTKEIKDADLVVFTGGEDISPELYGEENFYSGPNPKRDKRELEVFALARKLDKPTFGICRGMQFLNVMMGGKLWQDVRHHPGSDNPDHIVNIVDTAHQKFKKVRANTLHHQMVIPGPDIELIGWTDTDSNSIKKNAKGEYKIWDLYDMGELKDPEIIWHPSNQMIGVQFHPEFMPSNSDAVDLTFDLLKWIVY